MSGNGWASGVILALSTVVSPVTPVAPPLPRPTWSQPGPAGAQLTAGGDGSPPLLRQRGRGDGARIAGQDGRRVGPLARGDLHRRRGRLGGLGPAAEGERPGRRRWVRAGQQRDLPVTQPVAADPVKVGERWARLEVVTLLAGWVVAAVAAVPPGAVSSAIGRARSATNVAILDRDMDSPTFPDSPLQAGGWSGGGTSVAGGVGVLELEAPHAAAVRGGVDVAVRALGQVVDGDVGQAGAEVQPAWCGRPRARGRCTPRRRWPGPVGRGRAPGRRRRCRAGCRRCRSTSCRRSTSRRRGRCRHRG